MKTRWIAGPLLAVLLLAGCDTFYGFSRYASTQNLPGAEEVKAVLLTVPGVTKVDMEFVQPGHNFSLYQGIRKSPDYYRFAVYGTGVVCNLTIGEQKGREVRLYYYRMHVPLPEDERAKISAFMDQIYSALIAHFPDLPPRSEMKD